MGVIQGKIDMDSGGEVVRIRRRLDAFLELLARNDISLQVIAELEDKSRGDSPFEMAYLRLNVDVLLSTVSNLIKDLDVISDGSFPALKEKFKKIAGRIHDELARRKEVPEDDICVPLDEIDRDRVDSVGGKNAHLGELRNVLGLPVPDGFAISAWAYKQFIEADGFHDEIQMRMDAVDVHDLESTRTISAEIRERIVSKLLPSAVESAIREQCDRLAKKGIERVSVRSSAIDESTRFSFAGQYATYLNVPLADVPARYKEVMASKFDPMALFYLINKGFIEEEIAMSVCCLEMVDAVCSGVMQTADPHDPDGDRCIINSLWGLGLEVVQGAVTPDYFEVRKSDGAVLESRIAHKDFMVVENGESGVREVEAFPEMVDEPSISGETIKELVDYARRLEEHYGVPQEVEWAVNDSGKLYLLQSRPIYRTESDEESGETAGIVTPVEVSNPKLLEGGEVAYRGVAYGTVFILDSEKRLARVPNGCILVARRATPKIVSVMTRTRGIITNVGSPTGHMATLAREFMIPTLLNVPDAFDILGNGMDVTLDSNNRVVYEGRADELLDRIHSSRKGFFSETPVFGVLARTLKHIAPLNLVDPDSPEFVPENCETLHDVIRFTHQKAMAAMFTLADDAARAARIGTRIKTDAPLEVYVLDLGGGICNQVDGELVLPENICSAPMKSFWDGLTELKWPDPEPMLIDGPGKVIAGTIEDPLLKQRLKEKTLAIITESYMNFSLHLGYHLSAVEGLAASNPRDNYARLYFQGGGAASERRVRRARLVSRICEHYGFEVYSHADMVNAIYSVCPKDELKGVMEMLGRLVAYTKQLDMVMYNDDIVDWFVEEFLKGNYN